MNLDVHREVPGLESFDEMGFPWGTPEIEWTAMQSRNQDA